MIRIVLRLPSRAYSPIATLVVVNCCGLWSAVACGQAVRDWTGPAGGGWFTAANWSPAGAPLSSDFLQLAVGDQPNSGGATVQISFGGYIDMSSNANATTGALLVGSNGSGTLAMSIGTTLTSNTATIGNSDNAVGLANIAGSGTTWNAGPILTVGNSGWGTLNITSGADVISTGSGVVGANSSGTGVINLSGAGSLLDFSTSLTIGSAGNGTLNIVNDASVENTSASLGTSAGGIGRATVDSRGAWTSTNMTIGSNGEGILEIRGGGQVIATSTVTLGFFTTGVGRALVAGANSLWDNSSVLFVGSSGYGELEIRDGGRVECNSASIGASGPGSGQVVVSGPGAVWSNSSSLFVGDAGEGSLYIGQGGTVENTTATIADDAGSMGVVTIDGVGSTWSTTQLTVADAGTGTLNITGGGSVTSTSGIIGDSAGSQGRVSVVGPGSQWDVAGGTVTAENDSTIEITGGGAVTAASLTITTDADATVSGLGSTLDLGASLSVGDLSSGTMTVEDGAAVTVGGPTTVSVGSTLAVDDATFTTIGLNAAPGTFNFTSGAVTINGGMFFNGGTYALDSPTLATMNLINGAVQNDDELTVGDTGNAVLNMSGGSTFTNGASLHIGRQAGSTGVVNAVGANIDATDFLYIGNGGQGELNLTTGSSARANEIFIGALAGSTGVVNVAGVGTPFGAATDDIYVGERGLGELHLSGSAAASFDNVTLGLNLGGQGLVTVRDDATLTVAGQLTIQRASVLEIDGGTVTVLNDQTTLSLNGRIELIDGLLHVDELLASGIGNELVFEGGVLRIDTLLEMSEMLLIPAGGNFALGGAADAKITSQAGSLIQIIGPNTSLGDPSVTSAINLQGSLDVGANTLTLNSSITPARLGEYTTINGGQINAPSGISLGDGDVLDGSATPGVVNGRVAAGVGSYIVGPLTLGDSTRFDGFVSDGTLSVVNATMTLLDANQAVLGSMTELGSPQIAGSSGTLVAANGLVLNFGRNVVGFGTVDTPNDALKPMLNNGHIEGNSVAEQITLEGYVKGVGTFDNVTFTGTFDPGLSPALSTVGSITFGPTNALIMEIGGTSRGSEYDAILASGNLGLGGTLTVSLINGFTPALGDSFDLLDWNTLSGTFATLNLPVLATGLAWHTTQLTTLGILTVGLSGDFNLDGVVDAADFVVWRKSGFGIATPENYNLWREHFGESAAGSGNGNSGQIGVPEPTSLLLLVAGAMLLAVAATSGRQRRGLSPFA